METKVKCKICGVEAEWLNSHLTTHDLTPKEYKTKFPGAKTCSESYQLKRSEASKKLIATRIANGNPPRLGTETSKQGRKNMSIGATGKILSESHKQKIGLGVERNLQENPETYKKQVKQLLSVTANAPYKCGWINALNVDVYYRSSYELIGLKFLDSKKKEIISFASESLHIPYVTLLGKTKITVPDWLVTLKNGNRYLIEVKPEGKLNIPDTICKMQSTKGWAIANGIKYCVWTEETIFSLSSTTMSLEEILRATATTQNGLRYSLNQQVTVGRGQK